MNVLIVDDEAYSVEGIANSLDWDALGVTAVFKAYSMQQAQEVFRGDHIDIMLCDIEMPRGTGIDLMGWVRENGYHTVCIFLTCYSKFEYTSRAIKLQIFDYILKPADYGLIAETIQRASGRVRANHKIQLNQKQAEYWSEEQNFILAEFWAQLITKTIPPDEEKIRYYLQKRHLKEEKATENYYLLLIQILYEKEAKSWSKNLLEYAFKNILSELLDIECISHVPHSRYVVTVRTTQYKTIEDFHGHCIRTIDALNHTLPAQFLTYYSGPVTMSGAAGLYHKLEQDAKNNLSIKSMVFQHGRKQYLRKPLNISEVKWQNALLGQNIDIIKDEINDLLFSGDYDRIIDRTWLYMIYHNLLNAVYFALDIHKLPVHQPFLEKDSDIFEQALNSLPDFQIWVDEILNNCMRLFSSTEASQSIIKTVQKYIREHLDSDLSRATLAGEVHLNPDYLSFLFREKSGLSLSEYITQERLKAAKSLLLTTDLPVHEIAIRTGFQNISYFSKQFKRIEKQTPLQFRRQKMEFKGMDPT